MSALKRIIKEYKDVTKAPLEGVRLETSEENVFRCTVWFQVKGVGVVGGATKRSWLPMVVCFPADYPMAPPNCGFPVDFGYTQGASYVAGDGNLNGMLIVCLDILGNFAHVHDEWAQIKGSGWSPSYTLSSLMVIMQALINEELDGKSCTERGNVVFTCDRYIAKNKVDRAWLDEEKKEEQEGKMEAEKEIKEEWKVDGLEEKVMQAIQVLDQALSDQENDKEAREKLGQIASYLQAKSKPVVAKPAEEMFCWFSGLGWEEAVLGYGIQLTRVGKTVSLKTDGNYIAWEAFHRQGLRQYPNKDSFQFFLPAWICPRHAKENAAWTSLMQSQLKELGQALGCVGYVATVLALYPTLLNSLVVEMMNASSDVRASTVVFRCLLNLWRTFHHLAQVVPGLTTALQKTVTQFLRQPAIRHKPTNNHNNYNNTGTGTANVGLVLAMTWILDLPASHWTQFLTVWEEECALRRVLWWQKDGLAIHDESTFHQSQISRDNVLFQVMLRAILLQGQGQGQEQGKGLVARIEELDGLFCQSISSSRTAGHHSGGGGLEGILQAWKEMHVRVESRASWWGYYGELAALGLDLGRLGLVGADQHMVMRQYLQGCVAQANALPGYHCTASPASSRGGRGGRSGVHQEEFQHNGGRGGRGRGRGGRGYY